MSWLYDRTVTVTRAAHQTPGQGGLRGYGGTTAESEALAWPDPIPASIQVRGQGRTNPTDLPADVPVQRWNVYLPAGPWDGAIKNRDFVTDDLGRRFQVAADDITPMGYRLVTDRMEA